MELLIATRNPGKLSEYREILGGRFDLRTLEDLGIEGEPKEDEGTFEKNAIQKLDFFFEFSHISVLAEDSGLEIDYLNGEPGVLSRRWPGYPATDEELIKMTLEKLKGVPWKQRGAQFKVAMALRFLDKKDALMSKGILRGFITEEPMAEIIPGYPFRSLFFIPSIGKVLGELPMEEEAKIGHRKMALEKFFPTIDPTGRGKIEL